jgi:cysteine-rich repeat protein
VLVLAYALFGCLSPSTRHCPDVDCPGNEVCDNHGGCALPEQLAQCAGMPDGASCSYTDVAKNHVDGTCFGGLCLPAGCGNGRIDNGETCDDGNNTSGDGCSADCRSNETCGNGVVDSSKNEQCDDGTNADGSTCEHDCTLPVCGNGILDPGLNEACDAGSAASNNPDAPCRPNCQLPRCGDGVVDSGRGELCDDGNNTAGDGCSGDCKSTEVCGNGIVDSAAGEVCDDSNMVGGDGCSADCRSTETCGNGVVDSGRGEVCDDGNNISGDGCSADCRSQEICGNGVVDTINEQCDLGSGNSNNADAACRVDCQLQRCGDAILDTGHGEQCDQGPGNANTPDTCRPSCQLPRCGDGIMDTLHGEVCDDGNTVSGDGCSSDCNSNETCGNGIIDTVTGEQCDNGIANANTPDATCRTNCARQKCGDGIVDDLFGEVCDLGAQNSNAADAACRTNCQPQRCGDGVVDVAAGEVCDDSNVVSGDGCSADCKSKETCGNGIVDTAKGEQCDTGANNSNAANAPCRTNCQLPKCGDSVIDTVLGEVCDQGAANSNNPGAACRTNCLPRRCGDSIIDATSGEVCDDGNNAGGDGCSADCKSKEICGNGIVDAITGEQCDAGASNSNSPNAPCRLSCQLPKCGDSIIDTALGELCDAGAANSNNPNAACRPTCQPARCGDGIKDTNTEVCDDANTVAGDGCSADCRSNETCGNGIIDAIKGELCDNGGLNSTNPNATCRPTCQPQTCGDSIIDTAFGELCDAGAANSNNPNAACRPTCQPARCGDGIVDTNTEVCDDGNNVSGDGCSADCKSTESCGNGIVDTSKGEQCDAGAANSNAPNAPCRLSCKLPKCGDGIVDNTLGEICDAGLANSSSPNAACRTTCLPQRCGDGIVDNLLGEVCDDSNTAAGDGCAADCKSNETCGNGVVDLVKGEECDDGNARGRDGCSACKNESAVALVPGQAPASRTSPGIAYDGARQRVVMFGGWTTGLNLDETWEWDGVSWTQLHPKHSPSVRFDVAMAYDPVRHRIVLFGGYTANYGAAVNDTWEFDGVDWTQKTPTTVPTPRAAAAMAYDAISGRMLMFGGITGPGDVNETWSWDGTNWTLLAPALQPAARSGARMTWDSANKYILMFGGTANDQHTYAWTGSNWVDKGSTAGPSKGFDACAMAFDANLGAVVLWDGTANATYTWTGSAWSKNTNATPPARSFPNFAYDAARQQIVMFGGATSNGQPPTGTLSDTWVRSGVTWSQPAAFTEPAARTRTAAAYDPIRKKVVLFGGQVTGRRVAGCGAGCMDGDTWEWDGRKWTQISPAASPPARAGAVLDYDTSAQRIRLFGGDNYNGTDTTYTDVYSYDGSTWSALASAGRQSVRMATMSYDANANKLVTFGGVIAGTTTPVQTTWVWSSANGWQQLSPASPPSVRNDSATAYDPVRKRTVLFSGNSHTGTTLSDTWEWDGAAWTQFSASGPTQRRGHRLFYNPDAARVCVFGNAGAASEDLWEWNGSTWKSRTINQTVTPKYQRAVAYDAANHELVTFAGRDQSSFAATAGTVRVRYQANATVEACTSATLDYDNDGKAGCADDECWSVCTPLCPPGVTCPGTAPKCGDGTCGAFEDCNICPGDCGTCTGKCGDFKCDTGETHSSCPNDC